MMDRPRYRILLVEDDPDDRLIIEDLLADITLWDPELVWVATYDAALERLAQEAFDVALVEYRLGDRRGDELVSEPAVRRADLPIVILADHTGAEADLAAEKAGAADFLPKRGLEAGRLERSIRYAVAARRRQHRDARFRARIEGTADVTELEATRERTRFQAALLERVGQVVMAADSEGRVTYWNRAAEELTGYAASEVLGRQVLELLIEPADTELGLEAREASEAGRTWKGELRVRTRDGRTVLVQATVSPAINPDGTPGGRIAVGADITALRRAQGERHQAAERVRFQASLLDTVGQAVIATDPDGRITYWNRAAEHMYGWKQEEVLGRPVVEITPAEGSRTSAEEIVEVLRRGERWSGEFEVRRRDGSTFWALVTEAPIVGEQGELVGIVGVSADASERRALAEQLRQAQKMEAIGRLAGGVAHDFNNMLTAIKGHSAMVHDDLPEGSPLREDVQHVIEAADRAGALTRQLLAFSRKQVLEERPVDLGEAARQIEPMLKRLIPERIQLVIEAGQRTIVRADPGQLNQVMLNLVVNAVDAIEDAGRISLLVETTELSPEDTEAIPWQVDPGRYARLSVHDTGSGMPPEVLEHVFEPFFTTKAEGLGTGLGLSTVYGIVKQSGGHVLVESAPGAGTTFQILLPDRGDDAPDSRGTAGAPRAADRPDVGVVLLVEDDPAVRSVERRVLERAGYTVLLAEDGRQALELAARHEGGIDVVLSDLVMPEMGGAELADRLRELYPGLRVILASGYSEAAVRGEIREKATAFLTKPFTPDALIETVARTIAGRLAG